MLNTQPPPSIARKRKIHNLCISSSLLVYLDKNPFLQTLRLESRFVFGADICPGWREGWGLTKSLVTRWYRNGRGNLPAFSLLQRRGWQITGRISNLIHHKDKTASLLPTPAAADKSLQFLCRNRVSLHKCLLSHLPMKSLTSMYHYGLCNTLVTTKMRLCCLRQHCLISGFEVAVSALPTNYGFVLTV